MSHASSKLPLAQYRTSCSGKIAPYAQYCTLRKIAPHAQNVRWVSTAHRVTRQIVPYARSVPDIEYGLVGRSTCPAGPHVLMRVYHYRNPVSPGSTIRQVSSANLVSVSTGLGPSVPDLA
eukprot:2634106-Rhodomonas_salina.2